jgi:hypothetical protein
LLLVFRIYLPQFAEEYGGHKDWGFWDIIKFNEVRRSTRIKHATSSSNLVVGCSCRCWTRARDFCERRAARRRTCACARDWCGRSEPMRRASRRGPVWSASTIRAPRATSTRCSSRSFICPRFVASSIRCLSILPRMRARFDHCVAVRVGMLKNYFVEYSIGFTTIVLRHGNWC